MTSQNPLKIYPKSLQNRYPKKHKIFKRIFDNIFQNSKPRNLENINFASTGARFLRFSLKSCFCYLQAFSVNKTYQKPFQNGSEPLKNRCQKHIVFQHRFFRVSAWILEGLEPPRWSQVGQKGPAKLSGQPFLTFLS